jgi:hypothetical protein
MTKLRRLCSYATLLLLAATAHATPILTLQPGDYVSAMPGSTIGWGSRLLLTRSWLFRSSGPFLTSDTGPSIGSYGDIASAPGRTVVRAATAGRAILDGAIRV